MSATKGNFEGTIPVTLTGTVAAGDIGFLGDSFGLYMKGGGVGDIVPFLIQGKIDTAPKVGSQAWAVGDLLYWDATNTRFTKTLQNGTKPRAVAASIVGSGAGETTGSVILNPSLGDGGLKLARGVAAVTGSADVVTGLSTVAAVVATLQEDASLNGFGATATIGDQAGAPAAGSVTLKVWKSTSADDDTPTASGTALHVNWIAIGS